MVDLIEKVDFLTVAGACASALEAVAFLLENPVDLLFLDVNMPYLTGLEMLETIEKPPLTILTTAYSEYALEGYRLKVVDYLLKPITFQRFYQAALKAQQTFREREALQTEVRIMDPRSCTSNRTTAFRRSPGKTYSMSRAWRITSNSSFRRGNSSPTRP